MLLALLVLAIGYRYYSAFLAARVLVLEDSRTTPAVERNDGQNYHPTNKWVLFGHHFAAITGAGPLIGPVLAAQFGFLPGFAWILIGVVLAGAVHDFVILVSSVRRGGRSLSEIAREELGPGLGFVTAMAIIFIVVIALAGLGNVVVGALAESAWGVFTVGMSVPIALLMGLHIYKVRGGSQRGIYEASTFGCVLLFVALIYGKHVADSDLSVYFRGSRHAITWAIAIYGFTASVLPVWLLLCPRDYLSSYLKIGTIALLVVGILVVNPPLQMPALSPYVHGGGPIMKGPLYPFLFITIACGAISGFHALVASGTTPKMVRAESHCRPIGYGAMLMEGLVGITALLAACVLPPEDYVAINTDPKIALVASESTHGTGFARNLEELVSIDATLTSHDRDILGLTPGESVITLAPKKVSASKLLALSNGTLSALGYHASPEEERPTQLDDADFARLGITVKELPALSRTAGEVVAARTGGGVSLAIGMARVFSGIPGMSTLLSYWYHFAIMFEGLFILTTIDTGTRIGRFLVQEMLGRVQPRWGESTNLAGGVVATALVVAGWTYFILTGNITTIWPMFGIANQLLACTALCIATTILLREAPRPKYALVTFVPLVAVGSTTLYAAEESLRLLYLPMMKDPGTAFSATVNAVATTLLLACMLAIFSGSALRWVRLWRERTAPFVQA
jgi:carbon starvation protein